LILDKTVVVFEVYHPYSSSGKFFSASNKLQAFQVLRWQMMYSIWQEEQEQEGKQIDCIHGLEGLPVFLLLSLIVVMLFRLGMSIEDAIQEYIKIGRSVYSQMNEEARSSQLETAVMKMIQRQTGVNEAKAKRMRMWDPVSPTKSRAYVTLMFLMGSRNG